MPASRPASSLGRKICSARTACDSHVRLPHDFPRPSCLYTASYIPYICMSIVGLDTVMVLYPLLQVDHISKVSIQWVMAPVSNRRRYTSMTLCMVKLSMLGFYISIRCVMAFISHGTWQTSKTLCIVRFEAVMVHHFVVR